MKIKLKNKKPTHDDANTRRTRLRTRAIEIRTYLKTIPHLHILGVERFGYEALVAWNDASNLSVVDKALIKEYFNIRDDIDTPNPCSIPEPVIDVAAEQQRARNKEIVKQGLDQFMKWLKETREARGEVYED